MTREKKKLSLGVWDRLSPDVRRRLMRVRRPAWLGTLHTTTPISAAWGQDRGTPIDRYYIEQFLQLFYQDIHGRVLEVGGRQYTDLFGAGVESTEVLDNNPANKQATFQADLEAPMNLHSNQYDCIILTQVLQFIYNLQGCVQELHRSLRPGGVLLITVPCVSRIDPSYGIDADLWRFTAAGSKRLIGQVFGKDVAVQPYGNVLSSIAFLSGVAYEELSRRDLDIMDPLYQLIICIRAVKQP